ncbi:MAG: proline dehydrogenase family protein [Thermoplasmata archaeon]|nr:proline dehydrogenase family protein [Thermoplasmata archaeon]
MSFFDDAIVALLPMIPKVVTKRVAGRYVAGASLADAVSTVKLVTSQGTCATVDILGENAERREESEEATSLYMRVLAAIRNENLDTNISVKPTHLGLRVDKEFCLGNIDGLVAKAKEIGNFVRIDMEDHTTTTDTLDIYRRLRESRGSVGVAIQSYLRRSEGDVRAVATQDANFRLCKGIYVEPLEIAYHKMREINENFMTLLEIMFEAGSYVGIATHDDELIAASERLIEKLGLASKEYEFQMLLGVKERTRREIVSRGHKMRIYVPFGEDWFPYSLRRLKENPKMARNAIRELLKWDRFP